MDNVDFERTPADIGPLDPAEMSFKEAFRYHRSNGDRIFTWKGKKYTTDLAVPEKPKAPAQAQAPQAQAPASKAKAPAQAPAPKAKAPASAPTRQAAPQARPKTQGGTNTDPRIDGKLSLDDFLFGR